MVNLHFSDGRKSLEGIDQINDVMRSIGFHMSRVDIPEAAKPLIDAAATRPTTEEEQKKLISLFHLHRGQMLDYIKLAGRAPHMYRGGYMGITERGSKPYPKVYDLKAMSPEMKMHALTKFSRLHVNVEENGVGVDEVMTIVGGGPYNFFFVLPDGVVTKIYIDKVTSKDQAVRLCYSGLTLHAALMNADYGLIVAFACGPKEFDQVFDDPSVNYPALSNTNPWINYDQEIPRLLTTAKN